MLTYRECLEYLSRLGNEVLTMKLGLDSIRNLLGALGNPERNYPSVLIAGTNGKGSVSRFLAEILRSSGRTVGLFTSPHLLRVEERIALQGQPIDGEEFSEHLGRVVSVIREMGCHPHPTYFETLTATAFECFSRNRIDIAVLEVGMGGRLDSTNVVDPLVSIITPIGMDHQAFLGNTLPEIAFEKAGIIHPGRPVVSAPQRPEALEVLRRVAEARGSELHMLPADEIQGDSDSEGRYRLRFRGIEAQLSLRGQYQMENAALAVLAAQLLKSFGYRCTKQSVRRALERTTVRAVIEKFRTNPDVYVDGGHNPDAAQRLASFLEAFTGSPRSLIFGAMRDKQVRLLLETLGPCFDRVYLTEANSPRATPTSELHRMYPSGIPVPSPLDAYTQSTEDGSRTVVVAGSFYLAGQLIASARL